MALDLYEFGVLDPPHPLIGEPFRPSVWLSSSGSDANSGLTSSAPKLTLAAAVGVINATFAGYGRIKITSTSNAPIAGLETISSGDIVLEPADGLTEWFLERCFTYTSGWTNAGGGVWSRTLAQSPGGIVFVTTILDGDGYATRLAQNTTTPTTPSAGQYGQSGGVAYVHLPGSVSANSNTLKWGRSGVPLTINSTAIIRMDRARIRFTSNASALSIGGSANVTLNDGFFGYAFSSGVAMGSSGALVAQGCEASHTGNDGWNINLGTTTLRDCIGNYNEDEGASAHADSVMHIYDSSFSHNGQAGINSIGTSTQNLYRVTCHDNGLNGGVNQQIAGIAYVEDCTGVCVDCICTDNAGSGFYNTSGASVTVSGLTSGLAQGNGAADVGA